MKVDILHRSVLKSSEFPAAVFPGALRLPNGDVIIHFVAGSGFESADHQVMQVRSADKGYSWIQEKCIADTHCVDSPEPFTFCCKPSLLDDGSVITAGYGFFRDHPEMGLSDYAEKFKRFPEMGNYLLRSADNGVSWSTPEKIVHSRGGMEISGPVLACRDGKLRIFAAPFELHAAENLGVTLISEDKGVTWREGGLFFRSSDVTPWEVRSVELPSGRILLVFWAYDLKKQQHLNNHIVYSDDGGMTWSAPIDTKLRGQASNWLWVEGKLALLQARREGEKIGLYLNALDDPDAESFSFSEDLCLWDAADGANRKGSIEKQFAALKFGQPSGLELDDGSTLLIFWKMAEDEYTVQSWKMKISLTNQ